MDFTALLDKKRLDGYINVIQEQNGRTDRLDGWFVAREIMMNRMLELKEELSPATVQAEMLEAVVRRLPISIRDGEIFAGTEADAFARSYALINPSFKVEAFEGYCDEDAVYNDIEPNAEFTKERIGAVRTFWGAQAYAKTLSEVYKKTGIETREVVYFVERVTGHTIPDFRDAIRDGIDSVSAQLISSKRDLPDKSNYLDAMSRSIECATILAERYSELALSMAAEEKNETRRAELELIAATCARIPRHGARNLYEAIQSYMLLWECMNLEQLPNPFAFSVGNLDIILQPFFEMQPMDFDLAVQLVRHLLMFFCVGDRNWAISQNIMVGGMDRDGRDLTCDMTHAVMRAFEMSNYSQPNLSLKLHSATPDEVYKSAARFMFDFGHSTPSFFNDPVVFRTLRKKGVQDKDLELYAAAGCQEPLIMGKDSSNTTNSWLNLAKILELALNDGVSTVSGERIAPSCAELGLSQDCLDNYDSIKRTFFTYLDYFLPRMAESANACTSALALQPVPFHSAFMGGRETGIDMRDVSGNGTKYNGSGCLIHGMANVADSFTALNFISRHGAEFGVTAGDVIESLKDNFESRPDIRDLLLTKPGKYGNNSEEGDCEATRLVSAVNQKVNSLKNPFGNNFAADWSTPSTNLLYGYWTGATPDGRSSRDPLNYGLDPYVSSARKGLLARVNSQAKLDYEGMTGGSASGMSINPDALASRTVEHKAAYLKEIMNFVFDFNEGRGGLCGLMYVYFNVYSPEKLRHVMEHPEEYHAPVMVRIHGQYGDARHLSPDVLGKDVIPRLDPLSTSF